MARRGPTLRRGRTRPGRLRLLDALFEAGLLVLPPAGQSTQRVVVDLGFGDSATTTVELAEALTRQGGARVVGVERETSRVVRASEQTRGLTSIEVGFMAGDFDVAALSLSEVVLVRALNVLRGYPAEQVPEAQRAMLAGLVSGGVLLEGSTDTEGHLAAAHLWRRRGSAAVYEGLVLCTDLVRGFAPRMFRDVLPRDLRRNCSGDEPVAHLLGAWQAEFERVATTCRDNRRRFEDSARALSHARVDFVANARWLSTGAVLWKPERPSDREPVLTPGPLQDG